MSKFIYEPHPPPAYIVPVPEEWECPPGLVGSIYDGCEIFAEENEHNSGEVKIAWDKWNGGCIIPTKE